MRIRPGDRLPVANFGEMDSGSLRTCSTSEIFASRRIIVVGVPAAFSPICTRLHLPGFIGLAPQIRACGFDGVVCLSSSNPWVLSAWARQLDPDRQIRFISDGNLEFGRTCGLLTQFEDLFLGTCLMRFSMTVLNSVVERISVETSLLEVTCSSAESALASQAA